MISYKLCSEVPDDVVYEVFKQGYSDYFFKFDMDKTTFISRFLEIEASRELSYIAFDFDKPIGLILGVIKLYQGIKTMRCGGFAVIPDYRSKGVGKKLFIRHLSLAREKGCMQLYLEVLKQNHKAIKFYESFGYTSVYDYRFYKLENTVIDSRLPITVNEVDLQVVKDIRDTMAELHLIWQGEMFTLERLSNIYNYAILEESEIIAVISLKESGLINFLWVRRDKRQKGLAKALMSHGQKELGIKSLSAITSNHFVYEGFLRNLGFSIDLEQFEMMLPVMCRRW